VLTEWAEFGQIDPAELAKVAAAQRAVVDARHMLDKRRWQEAGWHYRAPGVSTALTASPAAESGICS
jgi:UDPglucose 6-dehydrogenase